MPNHITNETVITFPLAYVEHSIMNREKRMRELLACISVNFCNIAQKYHLSVREQVITSEKV